MTAGVRRRTLSEPGGNWGLTPILQPLETFEPTKHDVPPKRSALAWTDEQAARAPEQRHRGCRADVAAPPRGSA
jgi:hypothetical protein